MITEVTQGWVGLALGWEILHILGLTGHFCQPMPYKERPLNSIYVTVRWRHRDPSNIIYDDKTKKTRIFYSNLTYLGLAPLDLLLLGTCWAMGTTPSSWTPALEDPSWTVAEEGSLLDMLEFLLFSSPLFWTFFQFSHLALTDSLSGVVSSLDLAFKTQRVFCAVPQKVVWKRGKLIIVSRQITNCDGHKCVSFSLMHLMGRFFSRANNLYHPLTSCLQLLFGAFFDAI